MDYFNGDEINDFYKQKQMHEDNVPFREHTINNNKNLTANKTYKVLVNVQHPYVEINKNGIHSGLIYEAWDKIKNQMPEYNFEETFYKSKNNSELIEKINNENYDLGVGCIASSFDRVQKVFITRPMLMNRCVVLYKDKHTYIKAVIKFFFMYFIPFFVGILMVAVILGFIMAKTSHQKLKTSKIVALTAASFFGSKGELFRSITMNVYSVSIILLILIISTFALQLLQAIITNILAQAYNESELTREKLPNAKIIGIRGSNVPGLIETNYGSKIIYSEDSLEDTLKKYLENDKYVDGVIANSAEALYYAPKYGLKITHQYFTLNEHGWAVNFKTPELLQPLNEAIRKVLDTDTMHNLCKSHLGNDEAYMCAF